MKFIKSKNKNTKGAQLLFVILCLAIIFIAFVLNSLFDNEKQSSFIYSDRIPAPSVDIASCYSNKPIHVSLLSLNENHRIYYTLDGTEPLSSSAQYDGRSILIDENPLKDTFLYTIPTSPRWKAPIGDVFCFTILRAICVDENGNKGKELKASYIIDKEKTHHYNIPVFSFVFNPDDVFGYDNGIYVMGKTYEDKDNYVKKKIKFDIPWWQYPANYLQKGNNSDRPVFVDYFCLNGEEHFSFETKMRIHGFNTRGFAQKSFRVPIKMIDSSCVTIFNNEGTMNYIFRNGGNDWTKTLLRDAFIHEVMKGSTLSPQSYQPVVCFFNGEYWGLHTLRERFDELYIQNKYGISKDSVSILELDGEIMFGAKSEAKAFKNLIDFIFKNDMSKQENYEVVEQELDVQNLIDYAIVNMFFVNNDWPTNNLKYWRYTYSGKDSLYRDNRWRFVLSDMDWAMGFNIDKAYEYDMFEFIKNKKPFGILINQLLKNVNFKNKFKTSLNNFTEKYYKTEDLILKLNVLSDEIKPYVDEHIKRWRVIGTQKNWEVNVDEVNLFLRERSNFFKKQIEKYLN